MIQACPSVRSDFGLAVTLRRAWNLVPAEIRQSRTPGSFKRQIKSFLLNVSYGFFLGCCFVGVISSMTQTILICMLLSGGCEGRCFVGTAGEFISFPYRFIFRCWLVCL